MGDTPDRIISAPAVQFSQLEDEDIFPPKISPSYKHNSSGLIRRGSSTPESNGLEVWPASLDTRRPSANTVCMPQLAEKLEEEEMAVESGEENKPETQEEVPLDTLEEPLSPSRSHSNNRKPLSAGDNDAAPTVKPRAFNSNGTIAREPSKTNRMSDENSATLLEDSGEREGAGRRPELTSEEEEERVEELGLQLSEAADRFTDNYEGKCVHKPNSAQTIKRDTDKGADNSQSDSGLGQSNKRKKVSGLSEAAKNKRTINDYLTGKDKSQLDDEVKSAIRILQAIASEADSVTSIDEPPSQVVTEYLSWLLNKAQKYTSDERTEDVSTDNQVSTIPKYLDQQVADYVSSIIEQSKSKVSCQDAWFDVPLLPAGVKQEPPKATAEEEECRSMASIDNLGQILHSMTDKQLSTSNLVDKLATEVMYHDVRRNTEGVHVHLHIYNKPDTMSSTAIRASQDVTSQTSPPGTMPFRVVSKKLEERTKLMDRESRECLRRSKENLASLQGVIQQQYQCQIIPAPGHDDTSCTDLCPVANRLDELRPGSASLDDVTGGNAICAKFDCNESSCMIVQSSRLKPKSRKSAKSRTQRYSNKLTDCQSSCECLEEASASEMDVYKYNNRGTRYSMKQVDCVAPIQICRPVITSPRRKSRRSNKRATDSAISRYTAAGGQHQSILWNILQTEYNEIYSQGRPISDSLEFLKRCHPLTFTMSPLDRYVYVYIYNLRFDELYDEEFGRASVISLASHYIVEPVINLLKSVTSTCSHTAGRVLRCPDQQMLARYDPCAYEQNYEDTSYRW